MSIGDNSSFNTGYLYGGWELSQGSHTRAQNEQDDKQKVGVFRSVEDVYNYRYTKKLI